MTACDGCPFHDRNFESFVGICAMAVAGLVATSGGSSASRVEILLLLRDLERDWEVSGLRNSALFRLRLRQLLGAGKRQHSAGLSGLVVNALTQATRPRTVASRRPHHGPKSNDGTPR